MSATDVALQGIVVLVCAFAGGLLGTMLGSAAALLNHRARRRDRP